MLQPNIREIIMETSQRKLQKNLLYNVMEIAMEIIFQHNVVDSVGSVHQACCGRSAYQHYIYLWEAG